MVKSIGEQFYGEKVPALIPIDEAVNLYLDTTKKLLTASVYHESSWLVLEGTAPGANPFQLIRSMLIRMLRRRKLLLIKTQPFDLAAREQGEDWPLFGFTMVGMKRLDNIHDCIKRVLFYNIPGDFVECGVWRGGASIFARAVFKAYGITDRNVWLADSFEGMPKITSVKDAVDPDLSSRSYLAVSIDNVRANFELFGLLDEQVQFIKGWFADSLPNSPLNKIAVLRLDGDHYSSTMDALVNLYGKVSIGGCVIIDDYNSFLGCRNAVSEFRHARNINDLLVPIDRHAVYWIRGPA